MRRAALGVAVLALAVSGCGKDLLDGEVVKKDAHPGYHYTYMMPLTTTSCTGNPSICTTRTTGQIPIMYWVPPCYEIEVRGANDRASGDTCVDQSKWEALQVGDRYKGADVDPKDNEKEKQ